jgi:predicted cupin superfamily sugar epimerase
MRSASTLMPKKLDLIGRMEGGWYKRTREHFEMPAIALEDWRQKP